MSSDDCEECRDRDHDIACALGQIDSSREIRKTLNAQLAAKDAEIARLRKALARARKDLVGWAEYTDPDFREKWALKDDLAAIDAALAGSAADALKGET